MANTMTDAQNLVVNVPVQNFWGIFTRAYTIEQGFSLEVFRGSTHLGSIHTSNINSSTKKHYESLKLRSSDTILRVNLGSRILDVQCPLYMSDGWTRSYEGKLEIAVCDPYHFIIQYRQGSDPVALASQAVVDTLQRYARRIPHDAINDDALRHEARTALERGTNKKFGLMVVRVQQSNPYMDPKKAEILTIIQQGEVDGTKVNVGANITMLTAGHNAELQGFNDEKGRQRDVLNKQHERSQSFLDTAGRALERRMIKDIEDGVPLEIIARNYPQFAQSLGFPVVEGLLPGNEQRHLDSGSQSIPRDTITGSYTVVSPNPAVPQPTISGTSVPQPFHNAHLGASFVYMSLSDSQRQNWRVSSQVALMVYELDPGGPAEQGHMITGDKLIEIADQQIQSADSMIDKLNASQPGKPLAVRVLRGEQPLDLDIYVNHL